MDRRTSRNELAAASISSIIIIILFYYISVDFGNRSILHLNMTLMGSSKANISIGGSYPTVL